jgi:hypothetical protein
MLRFLCGAVVGCAFLPHALLGQEGIQRGTIKTVDAGKGALTITVAGKDRDFVLAGDARIMDAAGKPARGGLKHEGFQAGAAVMFKAGRKDGKTVLVGLKLVGANGPNPIRQPPPKVDLSGVKPLTDMGKDEEYKGFKGGLYPGGSNERPAPHEAAGVALARAVQPLDKDGKPSADGKVVLLAVGMSNTNQAFAGFMRVARADREINPRVVLVNGAQGGMTASLIQNPDASRGYPNGRRVSYWPEVDNLLNQAGATRAQVQAVWIKQADGGPNQGFPRYAQTLQAELTRIVQLLHGRFPHLKLVYLSSRTYGGWAKTRLNPEPYAYESGFSVKWLIEQQLKGDPALNDDAKKGPVKAPWLSWGPYLWANGTARRADGFRYEEGDFREDDRTHESPRGQEKIGKQLLQFFKTDTTTRGWFVRQGAKP